MKNVGRKVFTAALSIREETEKEGRKETVEQNIG